MTVIAHLEDTQDHLQAALQCSFPAEEVSCILAG